MSISSLSNEIFAHLYEVAELFGCLDLLRSIEFGESLVSRGQEGCCCSEKEESSKSEFESNFSNKSANQPPPHYITRRRPINTLPELPGQN